MVDVFGEGVSGGEGQWTNQIFFKEMKWGWRMRCWEVFFSQ